MGIPTPVTEAQPPFGPEKSLRGFRREEVKVREKQFVSEAKPNDESGPPS